MRNDESYEAFEARMSAVLNGKARESDIENSETLRVRNEVLENTFAELLLEAKSRSAVISGSQLFEERREELAKMTKNLATMKETISKQGRKLSEILVKCEKKEDELDKLRSTELLYQRDTLKLESELQDLKNEKETVTSLKERLEKLEQQKSELVTKLSDLQHEIDVHEAKEKAPNERKIGEWTCSELELWIKSQPGFSDLAQFFRAKGATGDEVISLRQHELSDTVPSGYEDRGLKCCRMYKKIREIRRANEKCEKESSPDHCTFFLLGKCENGSRCSYYHDSALRSRLQSTRRKRGRSNSPRRQRSRKRRRR